MKSKMKAGHHILSIDQIIENNENPRFITKRKFEKLCESLKEFPQMLQARPIVINSKGIIIGGSMRFRAARHIGMKEVPVFIAETWNEDQEDEFIIRDNTHSGQWDFDMVANKYDESSLIKFDFDGFNLGMKKGAEKEQKPTKKIGFKFTEDQRETILQAIAKFERLEKSPYLGNDDNKANAIYFIASKYLNDGN